jgi:hypothetical protein
MAGVETPHSRASPDSDIPDSPVSSIVKNSTPSRITLVIVIYLVLPLLMKVGD